MKRNEINEKYKWNLNHMYSNDEEWEKAFADLKSSLTIVEDLKEKMETSPQDFLKIINENFEISRKYEKLYVFAHMKSHEDTNDSIYQAMSQKADSLGVEISSVWAFLTPSILKMGSQKINDFIKKEQGLETYRKYFDEILRFGPHILSEKEEELLAGASELGEAPENIFSMLNNADIKFDDILDSNGDIKPLTKGNYIEYLESEDRVLRKNAFDSMYKSYLDNKNTLAMLLNSKVKSNLFESKVRKYDSPISQYLFSDNIDTKVYENLVKVINDSLPLLHRYMDLRKRMMGLEELHMYDLYTPIINEVDFKIDYEKAFEEVLESLKILGDDYYNNIQKAKVEGWIDVYESQGKIGGAYSWGCFETHPYVLLNHNDNLNSAFTLAHELGHAMHSFYSNSSNPYHYSHYKIFVAEVASTLNEALFMDYLQNKTEDINTRMYLINYFLEQFRTTVYRQTMFAEFEMTIHKLAKEGEILTYDLLSNTYYALNKKYYGENVIVDKSIEIEWARIPHFYTSFYVYKYATGFTSAMAILNLIKKDKDEAIVKYHEFLSSGGSDYPIEILKNAGVDMSNTKPIELAMGIFKELLDQMEDLVEKR